MGEVGSLNSVLYGIFIDHNIIMKGTYNKKNEKNKHVLNHKSSLNILKGSNYPLFSPGSMCGY